MKEAVPHLRIVSRGEKCRQRGVSLVDLYLSGAGGPKGMGEGLWMWQGGISEPVAEVIAEWFAARGVEIRRESFLPTETLFK